MENFDGKHLENRPVPDFAIFQNERTRVSAIWLKEVGKWKRCSESDYAPLHIMANMLRHSPNPQNALTQIAKAITELSGEQE